MKEEKMSSESEWILDTRNPHKTKCYVVTSCDAINSVFYPYILYYYVLSKRYFME